MKGYLHKNEKRLLFYTLMGALAASFTTEPLFNFVFRSKDFAGRSMSIQILASVVIALTEMMLFLCLDWLFQRYVMPSGVQRKIWNIVDSGLHFLNSTRVPKAAGWLTVVVIGGVLLAVHLRLVFFPYQMEYREGAILLTGDAFLRGINPWALEINPIYINVYGFIYNLLVLPFAWMLGNKLWIYRLISFLAIAGQIWIIARVMRSRQISWVWVSFAGLFVWLGQIFYTTPLARPDTLGQFFFLLTLFIPLLGNFSTKSLWISGACGLLAFYTKPYFVLGVALVALYTFLFVNKKKGLVYGSVFLGGFLFSALLVNRIGEAYFLNVYFSHLADTNQIYAYMLKQSQKFARDNWSLLLMALIAILKAVFDQPNQLPRIQIHLKKMAQPLFSAPMDFNLFNLFLSGVLIYFSLGRHNGTMQAYYYQLLTPFLVIVIFQYLQRHPKLGGLALVLVAVNLLTQGYENLKPDLVTYDTQSWKKIETYLTGKKNVRNSPCAVTELVYQQIPVKNSGQSEYFFPYPENQTFFYPNLERIRQVGDAYLASDRQQLQAGNFDLVMIEGTDINYFKDPIIAQKYQKVDTITFDMPHVFQSWQVDIYLPTGTVK